MRLPQVWERVNRKVKMIKRNFFVPLAPAAFGLALCVFSCTSAASAVSTDSAGSGAGVIHLNDFKWPPWEPLPPEYKALEAQAGPCASRDAAIQLAEFKAKLKVAELTAGISIAESRQFITAYLEESGVILVNQKEAFDIILSAVEVYISRVEIPQTFSGEYQGQWYAKTRAIFTREWEERETARLEPERGTIQAHWKEVLEKTGKRMEELNRDALAALKAANAPAREAMQEGHDYYNQQRYHDAIGAYSNAVRLWESKRLPPPAEVYEWIGHGHFKLKNYGKAVLAYEKALEVDPDSINALRALGEARAAEEQRLFEEAERQAAQSAAKRDAARAVLFGKDRLWSAGVSMGSSFAAPWLIGAVRGTVAPFPYSFLELGCDLGLVSGVDNTEYYSVYPYAHYAAFIPFDRAGGWHIGAGAGWMSGEYRFEQEGKAPFAIWAVELASGFQLGWVHLAYTLRINAADYARINHKVSAGFAYRVK